MAEEKPERDGIDEANSDYPQCNHLGSSLDGEHTAGPQKVSRQWGPNKPERQEDFETKIADEVVSAVCNEQAQNAMVPGDNEASPCRVESSCGHTAPYLGCNRIVSFSKTFQFYHSMVTSNAKIRTTPEQKEKTPEKLEVKTGKLEKRLLLRQFITKALEIKRIEIAELARRGDPEQPLPKPLSDSIQCSPQKLTFYEVVQLARQQAMVEKTRRSNEVLIDPSDTVGSNEDLIDLSDTPQTVMSSAPSPGAQFDHDLLDLNDFMTPQQDHSPLSFRGELRTSQLVQNLGMMSNQPETAELDGDSYQKPPIASALGLVELPSLQADSMDARKPIGPPEGLNQPISELCQSSEVMASQQKVVHEEPAALELVGPLASQENAIDRTDANRASASQASNDQLAVCISQPSTMLIHNDIDNDETARSNSPTSPAAPSIFSHSSYSTGATGTSLPEISEKDMQAHISSSQASLKASSITHEHFSSPVRRTTFDSAQSTISNSQANENDADPKTNSCIASTTSTHTGLLLPPKLERAQSEDSLSLSPSLPNLSNLDKPDEQGYPWIVQAARDGDEQMIRKLLGSGADIKASHTSTLRHALSEASLQGHQRIVDLLIDEGCPLDFPDADGNTALHHASRGGFLNVAKSLIIGGASINASGQHGQTPLHLAMDMPHQNVVMLLVQNRANVNARDTLSQTPLHIGAIRGNAAMCKHLVDEGAQLDSRDAQSKTPLQLACEAGNYDLAQILLDLSSLSPTSMTFVTAFFAAVEHGHVRVAECFFSHGLKLQELKKDPHKPITLAAKNGYLTMVELMIQEDCDINARDENGWNALHFASQNGHYHVIERLIADGASTNATTSRKETPLLFAIRGGHFAAVDSLLRSDSSGYLANAEDERCQQPVHHAVRAGSVEIFNLLISNGGKINGENCFGWRPIHIATAYGHLALVERILQQQGANIEEKLGSTSVKKNQTHKTVEDGYWAEARWPYPGSRPLHLACEYGHDEIASYLISKGAKMEAACSEGWQPLHHAAYFGSSALVEMLLNGGVNPHATTNEAKTAQKLQFCTSGAPIMQEDKDRIKKMLEEAMERVRKQKSFKVALKKGSTVEEKSELLRAANFSMSVLSKPPLHRASTSAQALDPSPTRLDLVPSSHRPRLNHLPHTSPLPSTDSSSVLSSNNPPTPDLLVSQVELESPAKPTTICSNLTAPSTSVSDTLSKVQETKNDTDQPTPSSNADTTDTISAPTTEMQLTIQPEPKLKRRTTFGLALVKSAAKDVDQRPPSSNTDSTATIHGPATEMQLSGRPDSKFKRRPAFGLPKAKSAGKDTDQRPPPSSTDTDITSTVTDEMQQSTAPEPKLKRRTTFGVDIAKLSLSGMGKPAFDIGKQTVDIGTKTLELSKQGIGISKQGLEKSRQGLEAIQGFEIGKRGVDMGKRGVDMGKRGVDVGKTGFKKAKKFAKKGRAGSRKKGDGSKEVDGSQDPGDGSKDDGVRSIEDGEDEVHDSDDDDVSGSDAGSGFSLGEFADLGSNDF